MHALQCTRSIQNVFTYQVPSGQFTMLCALSPPQCVLVTYSIVVGAAAAYWIHRQSKKETAISSANA